MNEKKKTTHIFLPAIGDLWEREHNMSQWVDIIAVDQTWYLP